MTEVSLQHVLVHGSFFVLHLIYFVLYRRCSVSGVYDLTPALEAVEANGVLNSKQLDGVAASLEAALSIYESVSGKNEDGSPKWPSLMALAAGIDSKEESIAVKAIRHCIRVGPPGLHCKLPGCCA